MNSDQRRKLSIELFRSTAKNISLYDYEEEIKTPEDIVEICGFLESYNDKYDRKLFRVEINNASFYKRHKIISDVIISIRELEPNNFEKLSALICKCFGYSKEYAATKTTHDEGIDFIASTDLEEINIDYQKYAIGQCKHFDEILVDVKDIRELAGSVLLFSRKEFSSIKGSYSRIRLGAFSNTSVFYISNYFFSEPAIQLCDKIKIIPLDILDIALICTKGIHMNKLKWASANGKFNHKKFIKDIESVIIEQ